MLLMLTGAVGLLYYLIIASIVGEYTSAHIVWALLGAGFIIWALLYGILSKIMRNIPKLIKFSIIAVLIAELVLFLATESRIISHMWDQPAQSADYVIILGAKVNGIEPSIILRRRVESTRDYLRENHATKVIACGGMGMGETITEAEAIKRLLVAGGVGEDRVIMEQESTNTYENLLFADKVAQTKDKRVVIATSGFHLCRALYIARRLEYGDVSGIPSKTTPFMLPNYLLREFMAIMRDYLFRY